MAVIAPLGGALLLAVLFVPSVGTTILMLIMGFVGSLMVAHRLSPP